MKKIYALVLLSLPLLAHSQIITQADLPSPGTAYILAHDSTYTQPIPAGGTGQNWDYSTLVNTYQDTQIYVAAAGTPYAGAFPTSTMAIPDASDGSYSYLTSSSTGLYLDGTASPTDTLMF